MPDVMAALLEIFPGAVLLLDAGGRVTAVSRSTEALLHRDPASLQAVPLEDLIPARYHAFLAHRLGRGPADGWMAPGPFDAHVLLGSGAELPVEVAIEALPDQTFACFLRDISRRRRTEEELALHATVVESMADGVCVIRTGDLTIIYANPHFEQMLGYGPGELDGRAITELNPAEMGGDRMDIAERIQREGMATFEIENVRKDGTRILCAVHATLTHHPTCGDVYVAVRQDITRQRQAEETLRAFNEMLERQVAERSAAAEERARALAERTRELEQANQELEAFSYSVSHDLRASLRAVLGFSQILEERHGESLSAEARGVTRIIHESAARMGEIVEGLLTLARLGRAGLNVLDVDMAALAKAALLDLEPLEGRADIRILDLPPTRGDSVLLRLVFMNLLSNALKFTRGRGEPRIEVGGEGRPQESLYYVRDNGVGFSTRYADRLFQPFQRLHAAEDFEGTGIGLATVERIVSRHGGRVWAESQPDEGATFWFSIPLRIPT